MERLLDERGQTRVLECRPPCVDRLLFRERGIRGAVERGGRARWDRLDVRTSYAACRGRDHHHRDGGRHSADHDWASLSGDRAIAAAAGSGAGGGAASSAGTVGVALTATAGATAGAVAIAVNGTGEAVEGAAAASATGSTGASGGLIAPRGTDGSRDPARRRQTT